MTDSSADLFTLLMNSNGEVRLDAQTYTIDYGVRIPPLKTGITIRGAGMAATVLECNGTNGFALWFQNLVAGQADYSIEISDLTIRDTSGTGACDSLLRLTQFNDVRIERVALRGASGRRYTAGKANVTQGSTTVTGIGTAWAATMAPGHLWVAGYPQEVLAVTGPASLILATPWQHATALSAAYSLDSGGAGLLLEGTSANGCTQYGSVIDLKAFGNRVGVWAQGRPIGGAGVSAFRFSGGRVGGFAGIRVPNSIGAWFGSHSDTCEWDVPVNNVAIGAAIEDGHQHSIINRAENDPPFCSVQGGAQVQGPTKGVLVTGSRAGVCFNNFIFPKSVYGFGNGVEWNAGGASGLAIDTRRCPAFGNIQVQVGPT